MPQVVTWADLDKVKSDIDKEGRKKIRLMYKAAANDLEERIYKLSRKSDMDSRLMRLQLEAVAEQVEHELKLIDDDIVELVHGSMQEVVDGVLEANRAKLVSIGFPEEVARDAFLHVRDSVPKMIELGRVYDDDWTLSKAIWSGDKKAHDQIQHIISTDVTQGRSVYDIAKDVQSFVEPSERRGNRPIKYYIYYDKDGRKVRDIRGRDLSELRKVERVYYIGSVDYNAERLARTMVSHAYQLSNIAIQKNDPWVTKFEWHSAFVHGRTCQICMDRDGMLYDKDKVPLDHPNGLCDIYPVYDKSDEEIQDDLVDWVFSEPGTYPDIDRYVADMTGYENKSKSEKEEKIEEVKEEIRNGEKSK